MKRTVLQINSTCNIGSTGRIAAEIGDLAIQNGWKSYIAYGRNGRDCSSETIKIGDKFSLYSHVAQTRLFDKHGLASTHATKDLIRKIEDIKPDIIHLHNIHGYYLNYDVLFTYLKVAGIPVVWTLHDCWSFTGHCSHFESIGCEKWKKECRDCEAIKSYPKSFFVDGSCRNYRKKKSLFTSIPSLTLVPVSNWLMDKIKSSFFGDVNCVMIHNGVDVDIFSPAHLNDEEMRAKYGIETGKKIVLGVSGVWTAKKGLPDFVRLVEMLDSNQYSIVLVGLNDEQMKILPKSIHGIKRTENTKELASLYSLADVFVNPTYEDTFPTVNIEALACGTPVITYNTGGSPEAIDSSTGIVVEKGNVEELVTAIENICNNKKSNYSRACRERAVKNFNKNDRYAEYIELYEHML